MAYFVYRITQKLKTSRTLCRDMFVFIEQIVYYVFYYFLFRANKFFKTKFEYGFGITSHELNMKHYCPVIPSKKKTMICSE